VPPALKEQLAIGAVWSFRSVRKRYQTLIKLTRKSESEFEEENLGAVASCR